MDYRTAEERIAFRLGQIDGLLKRRGFEEDLVLALTLLRRLWTQFAGEFVLGDTFGEVGNLLQTHARTERRLFLDFLAGNPWPPLRNAVFHLERLFRATAGQEDPPSPPRWFIDLGAAIEVIGAMSDGPPLDRIERAVSALFERQPAFSEGAGETVVRRFDDTTIQSYQGAEPAAAWAFNLAAVVMVPQLGLTSGGTPLPSLVRREVFRVDLEPGRRRAILAEMLESAASRLVGDIEESARVVQVARAELRRGRKHSRSADAYVLIAGAGDLSVRQLAVLLNSSHEGARKIMAQLVGDGLVRSGSGTTFAIRARGGSSLGDGSVWDSSLFTPAPLARAFDRLGLAPSTD